MPSGGLKKTTSGSLRHTIQIEEAVITQNEVGEPVQTWSVTATRRASVEPLQGQEKFIAQQVKADVTHRVRLRYLDGLTPSKRIRFNGRLLNIESVLNADEKNREMEVMCTETIR